MECVSEVREEGSEEAGGSVCMREVRRGGMCEGGGRRGEMCEGGG